MLRLDMRRARSVICALVTMMLGCAAAHDVGAQSRPWGEGYFPNLPVQDQHGRTLRFFDDVLADRIVVVSFVFTRCTDICPLTTARLAQAAERLEDVLGKSVHFVSISVDPVNDTPDKLLAYAQAFHSGPGWTFLTGRLEDIRAINARFGERMRSLNDHRNEVLLGNVTTREWQRTNAFQDIVRLEHEIRSMDPAFRARQRSVADAGNGSRGYVLPDVPGQALFGRLCSGCHAIGGGDRVGPDLLGTATHRPHDWLKRYIANPESMRRQADPVALDLVRRFPSVRMPNLGLTELDAGDLISYIAAQSAARAATQSATATAGAAR
jgi:protein SCO1/2